MKKNTTLNLSVIALGLLLFSSCKKKEVITTNPCEVNFGNLTRINQPQIISSPTPLTTTYDSSQLATTGELCEITEYEWSPGYDEPLLMSPTSSIFPGAIMGASSLVDGSYSIITGDRASVTLSTSFQNLAGQNRIVAPKATLSEVRNAIKTMLQGQVIGPTSANIALTTSKVYNESSLKSALSANVNVVPGSISGTFNWNSTQKKSRMIAKFTQVYYTVDIDLPSSPREFWGACPGQDVFNGQVPVVVSSVKYGRSAILSIESSADIDSLQTAVELALKNTTVNASLDYKQIINNSSFNLTVLGGNAGSAVNISDFDGLRTYVQSGANYDDQNPAEPLAFRMKFLDDYSDANVILYSKFTTRTCDIAGIGQVTIPAGILGPLYPSLSQGPNNLNSNDVDYSISTEIRIDPNDNTRLLMETNWSLEQSRLFTNVKADITSVQVIYTAPAGKVIYSVDNSDLRSDIVNNSISEVEDQYHYITPPQSSSSAELVDEFKLKFHTSSSDDFGGSPRCHGYIYYNPITLTLIDQ